MEKKITSIYVNGLLYQYRSQGASLQPHSHGDAQPNAPAKMIPQ
jgi:hypothetical protein